MTEGIISPCGGFRLVNGDWVPLDKDSPEPELIKSGEIKQSQKISDNVIQGNANVSIDNANVSDSTTSSSNQSVADNVVQGDLTVNTNQTNVVNNNFQINLPDNIIKALEFIANSGITDTIDPGIVLSNKQSQEVKQELNKIEGHDIQDPKILLMLGNASKLVFQIDEAENYFIMAKEIFSNNSNREGEIMCLISLGGLYKENGRFDEASSFFGRASNFAKTENLFDLVARSNCDLGHLYLMNNNFKVAKDYLDKSLNLINRDTDDNIRLEIYLRLGELYSRKENPDRNVGKAKRYFKKSMDISNGVDNIAATNRINLYLGDFELTEGNFQQSISHYNAILQSLPGEEEDKLSLDAKIGIGQVLFEQKKYNDALVMLEVCFQNAKQYDYSTVLGLVSYHIGKCKLELGNQQSALEMFHITLKQMDVKNLNLELQANLEIGLILRSQQNTDTNQYLTRARQLMKELKS